MGIREPRDAPGMVLKKRAQLYRLILSSRRPN